MADLRIVDDQLPESPFTLPVTTFRAEFSGCNQTSSGDKKLTLLVDRLDRYMIDEIADVGLMMEFTVMRKPVPADSPDHPAHASGRVRPRGKQSSIPDSKRHQRMTRNLLLRILVQNLP